MKKTMIALIALAFSIGSTVGSVDAQASRRTRDELRSSSAAPTAHSASHGGHLSRPFGLGVVIGEPTGLSAKYWLTSKHAIDFGLAYSFNSFVEVFADYLFHFPGVFGASSQFTTQLTPYIGIGGIFFGSTNGVNSRNNHYFTSDGSTAGLGLRLPLGIEWSPMDPPIGVFVELVPGLGIIPSTFGFLEAGIGVRYYF
jgi:hypothetical protein